MVRFLKHNQIDLKKWDACASKTPNQMIYAYSKYLNVTTNKQWDALVWGNYETIMPLPWNKKLIKKQVYMPTYVQQLGPFGNLDLVQPREILEILNKKYLQYVVATTLCLNQESSMKINLTLPLNKEYKTEIYKDYKKNRKYDSRQQHSYSILELETPTFLKFYKEHSSQYITTSETEFEQLLNKSFKKGFLKLWGAFHKQELCSVIGVTNWSNRLTLILSSSKKTKKVNTNAVLIDSIFRKYEQSNYVFDFEGSEIEGVAQYFKSFGAIENQYFVTHKLNKFYTLLKKS